MAAGKTAATQRRSTGKRQVAAERTAPVATEAARPAKRRSRKADADAPQSKPQTKPQTRTHRASSRAATGSRRTPVSPPPPPVAPCRDLERLQSLSPEAARDHVERYLHDVMSAEDAGAFEAASYRWELHLVEVEQLRLVRGVDLDRKKVSRYRAVLKRGGAFPALIALGGDGRDVTRDVLLCDGYHRAAAMRDYGVHYIWAWLAAGLWQPAPAPLVAASTRG